MKEHAEQHETEETFEQSELNEEPSAEIEPPVPQDDEDGQSEQVSVDNHEETKATPAEMPSYNYLELKQAKSSNVAKLCAAISHEFLIKPDDPEGQCFEWIL